MLVGTKPLPNLTLDVTYGLKQYGQHTNNQRELLEAVHSFFILDHQKTLLLQAGIVSE